MKNAIKNRSDTQGQDTAACKAVFLTAPASGEGKTTVTAGLARLMRNQGQVVRVFKTGPDYLDPQILEQASGQPVEQLDLWMAGEDYCQQLLHEAARTADLILIEGAMGMFDGEPSSADLAVRFGIPLLLVMNVKGMAQTTAALATGMAHFRDDVCVRGLIANFCGSTRHADLIREALPADLPLVAALARDPALSLPERHLGLVQANEIAGELEPRFEAAAAALGGEGIDTLIAGLPDVAFPAPAKQLTQKAISEKPLAGLRIGIARDAAFSFIYQANLRTLNSLGATYCFFSPLTDTALPECDGLWLPGGYPELHGAQLAGSGLMKTAIKEFFAANKPILAECGGLLYCLDTLTDLDGETWPMLGLLKGHGAMRGKSGCQGMQTAPLPQGKVRGHAHHRSRSSETPEPLGFGSRQRHPAPGEPIYGERGLTASYLHLFFASNPDAIAGLFRGAFTTQTTED